jgi:hypothetical protein
MKRVAARINEGSEITIPLRNLVSMIAFTAVSVWVYFGLVERIAFLEHNLELTMAEVEENDDWIDSFQPPKAVQDTVSRVHDIEIELARIKLAMGMRK